MILTWRKEWYIPYESAWSIFEKLKYVNCIGSNQLLSILDINININPRTVTAYENLDLLSLFGINNDTARMEFGFCLYNNNQNFINRISGMMPNYLEVKTLYRANLYYCQKCLQNGYHSLFHQFILFDHCPFHLEKLQNKCLSCDNTIPFRYSNQNIESGFMCKCGKSIIADEINMFTNWGYVPELKSSKIAEWLNLNEGQKDKIKQMYFINNTILEKDGSLEKVLELSKSNREVVFTNASISNLNSIPMNQMYLDQCTNNQLRFHRWNHCDYERLHDEIYESIRQTIKSVDKYLWNTILKSHMVCLTNLRILNIQKSEGTCAYSIAYVNWKRSFLEINLMNNELGPAIKRKIPNFKLPIHIFNQEVNGLLEYWINYHVQEDPHNVAAIKWLLDHLVSELALKYFSNVLERVKKSIDKIKGNKNPFINLNDLENNLPFIIFILPTSKKDNIEFYKNKEHNYYFEDRKKHCKRN